MNNEKYLVDRKFETIFRDALFFTELAHNSLDDHYKEGRYARTAILNLSIIPEVIANCLIEKLNLPKSIFKEIDKFNPLSKIDYFLWSHNGSSTEKGRQEVQLIMELQSIRNSMVHPKAKKTEWVNVNESMREADFGDTKLLKIPFSIDEWKGDDPFIVLRSVMAFLDYLFREKCNFSDQETLHLLLNTSEVSVESNSYYSIDPEWIDYQKRWSLRMSFLGVDCKVEKNI
ncbi:hypothetical protein PC2016_1665 [Pseudoalteromonas carrageenovora]|uniref:Uncharacterized protein n=1 Tax=Pseudoalteromonas carrageenovora IAM 12662 TaxID=1314868 RepID=A0A2K4X9H8_PSEVC|nr:hypothetical protein [Pseudoalteromonas carrageenovora]MBE0383320.1 hypothetical protein [Pseudoalteromonas carrageenovora IAM 12662]QBJ71876.1 hypothetical protein PC2016_1665 [Pseudoalteromonas carrageenovora]GEB70090.1 hypothetical protein PCA01_08000 [Pseudoalteromonas carrageenovora]SOU40978.1 conserved protein of unknown function [Pseudoalteromonas carrageenovora IAM 12662]